MSDEFRRALDVEFTSEGMRITLTNGHTFIAPFSERLQRGTSRQRQNYRLLARGIGIHWPDLDEDLNVDELYFDSVGRRPLMRECRFCGERTRWNSETCESCGKERWNDPDDTALGRSLGEAERETYEIALARVKMDKITKDSNSNDD